MRHPGPRLLEIALRRVRHDKLVAFSCKRRGICPSCGARRMAKTAAHRVDHLIPHVPVRQWVLSLPIPLRLLLAAQPELATPVPQVVELAPRRRPRTTIFGGAVKAQQISATFKDRLTSVEGRARAPWGRKQGV